MCDRVLVLVVQSGPGRGRNRRSAPPAARPPRPRIPPARRQHLRADDPAPRAEAGRPRSGRARRRPRPGAAAGLDQLARRHARGNRRPALQRPGRPAASRQLAAARGRRSLPARRNAAAVASGRIRRSRHQAHAGRQALRRHGRRPAQEDCSATSCSPTSRSPRISSACSTSGRATARRRPASARSSRTTCPRTTPNARLRAIINLGRYGELFAYDENAQAFSYENPQ